jgi:CRP-like cAMP-binding protein
MALRHGAKVDLLRGIPLFAACNKRQLAEIARISDEVDLPEGSVLIHQGEPGKRFYVVTEGKVEVRRNGRVLAGRGGDLFFGEISLLMLYPTTATITATTPVHALVITPEGFRRLINEYPGIQSRILLSLAQRLAPETI